MRGAERRAAAPRRRAHGLCVDARVLRRLRAALFKLGVRLVGGCCGTTPEHMKRIAAAARMARRRLDERDAPPDRTEPRRAGRRVDLVRGAAPARARPAPPFAEKSELAAKLARKQLRRLGRGESPRGARLRRAPIAAAKMLEARRGRRHQHRRRRARAGAHEQPRDGRARRARGRHRDDPPRLRPRPEPPRHARAPARARTTSGLRNLVIITGDPPKMGDFPDATRGLRSRLDRHPQARRAPEPRRRPRRQAARRRRRASSWRPAPSPRR